jgi:hypothetical protein
MKIATYVKTTDSRDPGHPEIDFYAGDVKTRTVLAEAKKRKAEVGDEGEVVIITKLDGNVVDRYVMP